MRPVYMITGGITKFKKANPEKDFRYMVKEAFDYALDDLPKLKMEMIDGAVGSYFSDHFTRQLKAASMVQDYLGLCPKPSKRIEGGGATGGLCFQSAWEAVSSGRMNVCLAFGFETMSRVNTWKGNEFIALASDTNFDFPVGGFYTGYYAMMVQRHMHEFGTTPEQLALVSIKNHANALYNPYAQRPGKLTVADVRSSQMVATPLTMLDICTMSDGAAVCVLASEEVAHKLSPNPVKITGVGSGSDAMRMADRPHGKVLLLPHEKASDYRNLKYPGVHSFRGGRAAAKQAYEMAGVRKPIDDFDFIELHDAYTSSEVQTYEDLGLCKYGEGGRFAEEGNPFMPGIDYGLNLPKQGRIPVNPSGGLLACGHPVGATGLMQAVFAFWQLQGTIKKHLGSGKLQIKNPKRGLIHSHAGTGTYITVSILERT
ncbi:thiolase C-terminal domain-containing protein [Candidatus Manganitrophus noduliformans]|uniref:propanoyl-CoA C-acyltransferase n=1 Tax=Candidatus Manganitrophus noduliformans TaxID=2606439 RepID=A0A7X6DMI2_9BACT|nr:thiolase domain-containing protein [Candidatus Manganitrophus noduliformans]NKE69972.1 thiolase domain-containing protein [Candidatus Manganitrophus noduliformans]